jgi:hypothetical protein
VGDRRLNGKWRLRSPTHHLMDRNASALTLNIKPPGVIGRER